MNVVKDLLGKIVYVELESGRKYKGKLDFVDDLFCKVIYAGGLQVVFPISQIKFIQEER